jgi:ATP-dependent exoDNAse (exonuclease V) beta subunit
MTAALKDAEARRLALVERECSLLVEAGAGSGKTALMAGRVALLMADGEEPSRIAAITFTELAAAELAERVRSLAERLLEGEVPIELEVALPNGLSPERRANLQRGVERLDDLTATTIHGFALDLIRPYPVEADVDPGARPMDAAEAAMMFDDVFEGWLRERLSRQDDGSDVVAQLALVQGGNKVLDWLRELARKVVEHPEVKGPDGDVARVSSAFEEFGQAIDALQSTLPVTFEPPEDTAEQLRALENLRTAWAMYEATPLRLAAQVAYERPYGPFTTGGTLRKKPGTKGAWLEAAKTVGLSKTEAELSWGRCQSAYEDVCQAFAALEEAAADLILSESIKAVCQMEARYTARKRDGALLDFDDLLTSALRMLRTSATVRDALAECYRHVLVDEFQDTDPRQAEIVWRLTGHPRENADWNEWLANGASRFVVGDPKQSIYRFRRADVDTYVDLRASLRDDPNGFEVSITTNFRSLPGILDATNDTFCDLLSADGQPGYTSLDAHRADDGWPAVARLELPLPEGVESGDKPSAAAARDQEAAAVARLCARLLRGDPDLPFGQVAANEIALLAPTGTELWRYERELERLGIPVSSQAGKGFYQRQEVQDLVALSRALADMSDSAALGALLRGPLVGVSEERLLDVAEALHQAEQPRLSLRTDPGSVPDAAVRRVLERLAPLAWAALSRTPYQTLSAALELLEVRALVRQRHGGRGERALANVERFLESSRPWAVRGLRAFAQDAYARWSDGERTLEGRPDAAEGAVTLITVHSAKGLEWDVVVPINTMGNPSGVKPPFVDRASERLWQTVGNAAPSGWEEAKEREAAAESAENIRLLYVAATRARDLLVLPKPAWEIDPKCWLALAGLDQVPGFDIPMVDVEPFPSEAALVHAQDADTFREEAARILEATPVIEWHAPSRHDVVDDRTRRGSEVEGFEDDVVGDVSSSWSESRDDLDGDRTPSGARLPASGEESVASAGGANPAPAYGDVLTSLAVAGVNEEPGAQAVIARGHLRGLILHALMEQLISGEVVEEELESQAVEIIEILYSSSEVLRPDPAELATAARRGWNSPEVAAVRGDLIAELDVYGHSSSDGAMDLVAGVADAVAVNANGEPYLVIDWKSDVDPQDSTVSSYREQVIDYLTMIGARRGLLVFLTTGRVVEVEIPPSPAAEAGALGG